MSVPLDVRYGLRRLNNNVGFTMVAIACLALGICASITVFAVADALLIRDFPGVVDQDRIVSVATRPLSPESDERGSMSYPTYLHYRRVNHVFSDLAAFQPFPMNLSGAGEPLRLRGHVVSDNYFTTLGMKSAVGRLFEPGESERGDRREVVLSHALWKRLFGKQNKNLGSVDLNGQPFVVIGVAPEDFRGTVLNAPADLWVLAETVPLFLPPPVTASRDSSTYPWVLFLFGRLAPGMDAARAQAELDVLSSQLSEGIPPGQQPPGLEIHEDFGFFPGMRVLATSPLLRLSGLVGLLMLVVCANLGGLLLVKAAARQEEIGVRLALGVTRGQLVRQLLTESIALSLLGGFVGFLISLFVVDAIRSWPLGRFLPTLDHVVMDARVVAFTLALSVGTGVLFGLAPALWATRRQPMPLLHYRAGGGPDGGRLRFQEALVVVQVTLSLILLVSTGLIVRTLQNLYSIDPGFHSEDVLKVSFDLSQSYSREKGEWFQSQLLEQVRKLPQVREAALAYSVPLTPTAIRLSGTLRRPAAPEETAVETEANIVTPGFFETLEIPLVRGRYFTSEDRGSSIPVLIVDDATAALLWPPGRNPIGEQVEVANGEKWEPRQVVGVVRRIHSRELSADPQPLFYVPFAQRYMSTASLQVKTVQKPSQVVGPVRAVFRRLDSSLAVQVSLLEDEVNETLSQARLFSVLLGGFSLTALLVTAIGLYGTLSYAVSRRTRELGIRMALGARSSEIMGMVLWRGLALTLLGLALGTLAAVWATSILSGLLFGVTPTDPGVFVTVAVLLTLVGFLASSLPAWRATRVDPMAIIRHE